MKTQEKIFNAMKGILIVLTIVIILMLPVATKNMTEKTIQCRQLGYDGFAEEKNNTTYCYKKAGPPDPVYIKHLRTRGMDLPVDIYSIEGQLKISCNREKTPEKEWVLQKCTAK